MTMDQSYQAAGVRQALRSFHYGLHILTCGLGDTAHAATITWVMQISLKPRQVDVGIRKDSHIYTVVREHRVFALNVVGEGQEDLAATFFKYVAPLERRFAGYPFEEGATTGSPLLLDCIAWLECRLVEEANEGGDHGLFVAEILSGGARVESPKALSLATTPWSYGG
jgi:flavin reductase (DIM6/NTAB) family NADH-FMN oxidoreductase RutF